MVEIATLVIEKLPSNVEFVAFFEYKLPSADYICAQNVTNTNCRHKTSALNGA